MFKAQVALAALREDRTMKQLLGRAAEVFDTGARPDPANLAPLLAKIGQLALETIFWKARSPKRGLLSEKP